MRVLLASLVLCSAAAQAQMPVDAALVGAWSGTGQVATSAMAKTGSFTLEVDSAGTYLQVFRGAEDFVVDWGGIFIGDGEYWRKTANGLEDRGGYARRGNGFAFTGAWSRFTLQPAPAAEAASFARVSALLREPPQRTVEDWKRRAGALALLWQADATLDRATIDRPTADGLLGPLSSLTLTFVSPSAHRALTLRPTPAGGFDSAVTPVP